MADVPHVLRPFAEDCIMNRGDGNHYCTSCLEDKNEGYGFADDPVCCQCGGGGWVYEGDSEYAEIVAGVGTEGGEAE